MAACDPISYNDVDEMTFNCLRTRLEGLGYTLPGTKGTISGPMGLEVDFDFDSENKVLYTQVIKKNFLISCSRVESELKKAIDSCRSGS